MIEVIQTRVKREVDPDDLITITDAVALSGRKLTTIAGLMSSGYLPWFEIEKPANLRRKRESRYTSKKAVLALGGLKRPSSPDDIGAGE